MIEGKVWGSTMPVLELPTCSVHRLEIKQGGYCSEHRHRSKFNLFYVEQGVLSVKVWNDGPGASVLDGASHPIDQTILHAGDRMIVPPGKAHMFEAVAPTVAYEAYWVALTEDIQRRTCGGLHKTEDEKVE